MKKLTKAEEEIMQYYWEHGELTTRMLRDKMGEDKIPQSTISSITRILEKKGFVDHKAYGRSYVYFPLIQKSEYSVRSLKSFADRYFGNSMSQLISFLVQSEEVNADELRSIIDQIEEE